jgi:hypothetical protein
MISGPYTLGTRGSDVGVTKRVVIMAWEIKNWHIPLSSDQRLFQLVEW